MKAHWTPRYIMDRIAERRYIKRNPGLPWLTQQANEMLDTALRKSDAGLEFGAGRSTMWFAKRLGKLTSVEHHQEWFENVKKMIDDSGMDHVTLLQRDNKGFDDGGADTPYAEVARDQAPESLDFVLVDGRCRSACALAAVPSVKLGGMLIIDDCHRYLPSMSHSPLARRPADGPANDEWSQFLEAVKDWRMIWTSNGVSDTVFYIRA